ncbi:MAG: hydrolase [Ilumatobacteraceae bacterium]|nr:hydrolase [Ilumatobacteraceae bacterium]
MHPGGPFWARKDLGAWSIPKGEYESDEDPRTAALREFREELGVDCPAVELTELGEITQSGGKRVVAWCGMGTIDTSTVVSNTFEMEWPPRSGVMRAFPEVDRAEFFAVDVALDRVVPGQRPLIERAAQWVADTDR